MGPERCKRAFKMGAKLLGTLARHTIVVESPHSNKMNLNSWVFDNLTMCIISSQMA